MESSQRRAATRRIAPFIYYAHARTGKRKQQQQHHLTPLNSHLWMSTISPMSILKGEKDNQKKQQKKNRDIFLA